MTAIHFHTVGAFAGLLFVNGPLDGTGGLVKFISFENHLVIAVLFIGKPAQMEFAHMINHRVMPGRALITKQHSPRRRLIGRHNGTLLESKFKIDTFKYVAGSPPGRPGVVGGNKCHAMDACQGDNLAA